MLPQRDPQFPANLDYGYHTYSVHAHALDAVPAIRANHALHAEP